MRHIISVLLENESGALSRVSGLFSARSFNIESLSVAPSEDETTSRMTIVTSGNDSVIEQIVKQLDKLIDVIEVSEITSKEHLEREIAFVKIGGVPLVRALYNQMQRQDNKALLATAKGENIKTDNPVSYTHLTLPTKA